MLRMGYQTFLMGCCIVVKGLVVRLTVLVFENLLGLLQQVLLRRLFEVAIVVLDFIVKVFIWLFFLHVIL